MRRTPVRIEIVGEDDDRVIVKHYDDGSEEREPVVRLPRRKRYPPRPYRHWILGKTRNDEG